MKTIETYIQEMKQNHHFMQSGVWKDIITRTGRKYIKICSVLCSGQVSIIQFVDPVTLNIYKAKSWKQKGRLIGKIS